MKGLFMTAYNVAWAMALPFLACSSRLRQGWIQRLCVQGFREEVDVWIQASSAGEAYLAAQIVRSLSKRINARLLVTCSTAQGIEIFTKATEAMEPGSKARNIKTNYFPFDMPIIIKRALRIWRPRLMVLLETELWPGLLAACKSSHVPVLLINGRLSEKSLRRHARLGRVWQSIGPDRILAISEADASRFKSLFPHASIGLMQNMKFDRISFDSLDPGETSPLTSLVPPESPFVVMGSVRKQEEADVLAVIEALLRQVPAAVVGLFPRHMHRVRRWTWLLQRAGLPFILRSEMDGPTQPGSIILWDVFGELSKAYRVAVAAFVGGTLRPCGGQNFLEPLATGLVPCIGPYWKNFLWVGEEILEQGLVIQVKDRHDLVGALIRGLGTKRPKAEVIRSARQYVEKRRGGTERACREIESYLARY